MESGMCTWAMGDGKWHSPRARAAIACVGYMKHSRVCKGTGYGNHADVRRLLNIKSVLAR